MARRRRNPSSTFDEDIVHTASVLHTHTDPKSNRAAKYIYVRERVKTGETETVPVWIFADAPGDINKLIDDWNHRSPTLWRFALVGLGRRRNPGLTLARYAAKVAIHLGSEHAHRPRIPKDAMHYVRTAWARGWPPEDTAVDLASRRYKRKKPPLAENNPSRRS